MADLVVEIRTSARWLGGSIDEPDAQALVNRLVARAVHGSHLAVARQPLAQILDALRAPGRATELPADIVDRLSVEIVLEMDVLLDQIDRGLVEPGEIADALRRARLHVVRATS